jgi:NAD+ kinase
MDEIQNPKSKTPKSASRRLRAVVLGLGSRPHVVAEAERLRPLIAQFVDIAIFDLDCMSNLSSVDADVAIVFGGDGSILRAAHQMGRRQWPVIAVNLGKLGFLADLSPAELPGALRDFSAGKLAVVEHLMFEARLHRGGRVVHEQLGLNEVAIHAGAPFCILEIDLYVDAELVTTYSCDGLIVSTPVGSTAHSLSAGGPILRKNMQAFVVSPISPHTLTNRPVVDTADHVYELVVPRPHSATSVVVDGRVLCTLQPGDRLQVVRAEPRFKMVSAPGHSYYRTLREKLGWGGQITKDE